jgi:uncharacterized metal-binding protein YceD (DUF177 family)
MSVEFPRPLAVDRVGPAGLDMTVTANAPECAALARRMGLPGVLSLACHFRLRPAPGGGVDAEGKLSAKVRQVCIVSLDEFEAQVAEDFVVRFVPAGTESENDDPDSVDEIPFGGPVIDLGEATAEQLALALDPYPRKPGAVLSGETGPERENPFARLAALRPKN